MFFWALSPLDP